MAEHYALRIFAGTANCALAQEVSRILEVPLGKSTTTHLADSEIHVSLDEAVRDQDVFIIQPCAAPVNDNLMELLLYLDAFRRASAHDITAVIPYYPYGRQERMSRGREAISARVVATVLETMGVSRVIYFDVHAPAIQGFFRVPVDPLSAMPELVDYWQRQPFLKDAAIVSPDVGRAKLAGKYANVLELPLVVMHKRRTSFGQAEVTHVVGDIEGKIPIVIDDVIAGGSVLASTQALVEAGARPEVYFSVTHGVLLPKAMKQLEDPVIKKLVISDTIEQPLQVREHPKVEIVSIAKLLAEAIRRVHVGESLSSLIEKALA